jgi:hypothetical protein
MGLFCSGSWAENWDFMDLRAGALNYERMLNRLFLKESRKEKYFFLNSITASITRNLLQYSYILIYYNATINYLRTGSMSSRHHVCNLSYQTLSGYLICPITITNNYFQIRINTLYLQPLTILHDFTNMTYLKMLLSRISQQLDLILS